MIMGKIIKVPLRINMMNLHSPTGAGFVYIVLQVFRCKDTTFLQTTQAL